MVGCQKLVIQLVMRTYDSVLHVNKESRQANDVYERQGRAEQLYRQKKVVKQQ